MSKRTKQLLPACAEMVLGLSLMTVFLSEHVEWAAFASVGICAVGGIMAIFA